MTPTNGRTEARDVAYLGEQCVGVLDSRSPDEKLEVVWRDLGDGRSHIELRIVRWGEGVGWYVQRTLPIVSDIEPLCALLRRAKRMNSRLKGRESTRAKVLPLPSRRLE